METKKNFIKTSDKETRLLLIKEGYTEVGKEGNKWVFINDKNFAFSEYDQGTITYSDMLNI